MYHEITKDQARAKTRRRIACAVALVVLAVALVLLGGAAQQTTREQGAAALRQSVLAAAKQCCAVEGSYPSGIEHLEQDYGLVVNHDAYIVYYEWFAGNVAPSVTVVAK